MKGLVARLMGNRLWSIWGMRCVIVGFVSRWRIGRDGLGFLWNEDGTQMLITLPDWSTWRASSQWWLATSLEWLLASVMPTRGGELRARKLKSHLVRTQSLNVLPFKPGVGQYIAIHATFTAREFFLAYFYPSSPFTCIFSKTSPNFFLCCPAE